MYDGQDGTTALRRGRRRLIGGALTAAILSTCLAVVVSAAPPAGAAAGDCDGTATNVQAGLTNVGFESDLTGWRQGTVTDSVAVVGADEHTAPYEGSKMVRLGTAQPSSSPSQPPGRNEICQDFVVDSATEAFVYNVYTYDYTGFDEFEFELSVSEPGGATIVRIEQGAFGSGTEKKTTGWRYVPLNLADHMGETLRVTLSGGGTSDSLYAFWAYVDSADSGPPPDVVATPTTGDITSGTGTTNVDPTTGFVSVTMPNGNKSDLTVTTHVVCEEGAAPSAVTLFLGSAPHTMVANPSAGTDAWTVTIPAANVTSGTLSVQAVCDGVPYIETIGQVSLIDPSGFLTDAVTGNPVAGATVTLHKVPSWSAGLSAEDPDGTCALITDKPEGASWTEPGAAWNVAAPTDPSASELGNPYAEPQEIDPKANPISSGPDGYYGWLVAPGCWYVSVTAAGYQPLTSPVVGVASGLPVTDLDLELQPEAPAPPVVQKCNLLKLKLMLLGKPFAKVCLTISGMPPPVVPSPIPTPAPPTAACPLLKLTLKLLGWKLPVLCL